MSKKTSPTQRSLALLRERGYVAEVVERWNPFARVRHDLFGFADIIAIKPGDRLLVQTTSGSNVAARIAKIGDNELAQVAREAGFGIHVHGWRKLKSGWACREVDLS